MSRRLWNRLLLAFSVLVIVALTLLIYATSSYVTGSELNPVTFEYRRFSYHRDPFTGHQLTGIKYLSPPTSAAWLANAQNDAAKPDATIEKHLRSSAQNSTKRWDLVELSSILGIQDGPARLLIIMMSTYTPDLDIFWVKWTRDHPTLASVFWPAVQDVALADDYVALPQLFELAVAIGDGKQVNVNEFKKQIASVLFPRLLESALQHQSSGDAVGAREIATLAVKYGHDERLDSILSPR